MSIYIHVSSFCLTHVSCYIILYQNYYTYLGNCKDPNPYLFALWLNSLAFSVIFVDTDF